MNNEFDDLKSWLNKKYGDKDAEEIGKRIRHLLDSDYVSSLVNGRDIDHSHDEFLNYLLQESLGDETYIRRHMDASGLKYRNYYCIISIPFQKQGRTINHFIERLKYLFPADLYTYRDDHVVLLIGKDDRLLLTPDEKNRLTALLKENDTSAYESYDFSHLSHTYHYYQQSITLSHHCRMSNITDAFNHVEDYDTDILFQNCLQGSLSFLIHPDIKYLNRYDVDHQTEYLKTIETYIQCNHNAQLAADTLHIHKSTFFFRISKISELVDFSLENKKKLFSYELSLRILQFNKNAKKQQWYAI